jgi:cytidyltransferase-like protein
MEIHMTAQAHRTVLTYGTFDLFHPGHVQLLKRARELGTRLVVGLSTDEFNALKGKKSVMSYEDRKAVLEACRYVDEVFAEEDWAQKTQDAIRCGAAPSVEPSREGDAPAVPGAPCCFLIGHDSGEERSEQGGGVSPRERSGVARG